MIAGVGVDSIEISRVESAISKNPRFLTRVYAESERAYIMSKGAASGQSAAGIFAAKEAVAKALKTGFGSFAISDIIITHDKSGAPGVAFTGNAAGCARGLLFHISITHDKGRAMAFCVAERES